MENTQHPQPLIECPYSTDSAFCCIRDSRPVSSFINYSGTSAANISSSSSRMEAVVRFFSLEFLLTHVSDV